MLVGALEPVAGPRSEYDSSGSFSPVDNSVRKLLEGARIAFVGPAQIDEQDEAELATFDIVIRPNYLGSNRDEMRVISSFGGGYVPKVAKKIRQQQSQLAATFFKNVSSLREAFGAIPPPNATVIGTCDEILLGTSNGYAAQNVLYFLLRMNPLECKLFGVTFYASRKTYRDDYGKDKNATASLRNIRIHEPFSNYSFISSLVRLGKVKADRATTDILQLGRQHYAEKLDRLPIGVLK